MNKNILVLVILGIMVLFMIPNVIALGITPGRTTIDFSPNLEKEIKFDVINSENKNMNVAFVVQGELEEIITLDSNVVHFNSEENSKSFSYKIKLPSELSPGLHKLGIVAIELPEDLDNEEIMVRATVSVVTQLYIYVPYPGGKHLDANLDIVSKEETNVISFYIPIISRGEEYIEEVKGVIEIYQENEKIVEIETNKLSISLGERKELEGVWDPDVVPGKYNAIATVDYDGNKLTLEKQFEIGEEFIRVLGVSVNDFQLGEVAKIKILVQNKQSNKIDTSRANLDIYDSELTRIIDLKSEDYEIPGLSNKELIIYWDTENIEGGQYTSELKVNYDEKVSTKNLKMDISKDSMIFTGVGFVISEGDIKLSTKNLLIIIIGVLVLANLFWFIWWLRKKIRG